MKKFHIKDYNLPKDSQLQVWKGPLLESFPEHTHDFSELVIILGGTAEHTVNNRQHFVKAGDVYVFNGNAAHGFCNVHELILANIAYAPELLSGAGNDLKTMAGFQALFVLGPSQQRNSAVVPLHLTIAEIGEVRAMVDKMLAEDVRKSDGYQSLLGAYFMELVVYVCRQFPTRREGSGEGILRLARTVGFLEKHYQEPLQLDKLAAHSGVSIRQFIRVFKKNFKTTPIDYVVNLRLHHACRLLAQSGQPIAEIAYDCGFGDGNYFSRQFKKRFGKTPSEYRAKKSKNLI